MKCLIWKERTAIRIDAIESVQLRPSANTNNPVVLLCTKQLILTEEFNNDEDAEKYFWEIVQQMETSE